MYARVFDADGVPPGPERQVNSEGDSWQEEIDIGVDCETTAAGSTIRNDGTLDEAKDLIPRALCIYCG